jgi:hypothetical protein
MKIHCPRAPIHLPEQTTSCPPPVPTLRDDAMRTFDEGGQQLNERLTIPLP